MNELIVSCGLVLIRLVLEGVFGQLSPSHHVLVLLVLGLSVRIM